MQQQAWLETARNAAEAAAEVIWHYYGCGVEVETKSDHSPVTVADREAERVIREIIQHDCPKHAFYGEESGHSGVADAEYRWLVDPIDGTKSFVRGYPFFSTQIALARGDEILVGVSSAPWFGETAWAVRGGGARLNGEPIRVSEISDLSAASLSAGNITGLAADSEAWARYGALLQEVNRIRGYGDFYHYHLLARGAVDVVIESDVNVLDIAALSLIVTEAGGRFSDLAGKPVGLETTSVLAANPFLYPAVHALLK